MSKVSFKKYIFHLLAIIVLVIGGLFFFFEYYLPNFTRHGEEIAVPSLKGKSLSEIEKELAKAGFRFQVNDSAYVKGEVPGKVINQNPIAGSKVKSNRKIYLTITSHNPTNVEMPDLINKSFKSASLLLSQVGLEIGDTTLVLDEFPIVLKQSINGKQITPGMQVPKYSKVDMEVGNGMGPGIKKDSIIIE